MTMISRVAIAAIAATVCLAGVALADDDDYPSWRPNGKTAASITGPVILLPTKLRAANTDIPLRRDIEIAGFRAGQGDIPARLYAVTATTNPTLLNGNKLCSAQPTWIVVVPLPPEGLQIDAFSSTESPRTRVRPACAEHSPTCAKARRRQFASPTCFPVNTGRAVINRT